jgi:hypothetical protein
MATCTSGHETESMIWGEKSSGQVGPYRDPVAIMTGMAMSGVGGGAGQKRAKKE